MTPAVSEEMVERLREHLTRDLYLADSLHDEKGSATVRSLLEWLPALSTLAPSAAAIDLLDGNGWVFWNPDSGEEYSQNHPIESGECDDAEHIRKSTRQEDALWAGMQEQFKRANALASPSAEAAQPVASCPVVSEELVEQAWCSLVNMDDRTSPEEYPDMALIKFDELREIIAGFAAISQPQGELREALAVTDEMLEAAMKVFNEDAYRYQTWRDHVRAMIDAALTGRTAG